MKTSETIAALAEALAKAQASVGHARESARNPHFKSSYATLAEVYDACRGALASQGLAVVQGVGRDPEGRVVVTTRLVHASGEWIESEISQPPPKGDVQSVGSMITYLRRYSLAAIAGVAPGDDDDGNAATAGHHDAPRPTPKPRTWTDAERDAFRAQLDEAIGPDLTVDEVGPMLAAWCERNGRPTPPAMTPDQRAKSLVWLASAAGRQAVGLRLPGEDEEEE